MDTENKKLKKIEYSIRKLLRKLKRFFSRFGYQEVGCDCNIGGAPAHIMAKPCKCKTDITPVAHRILPDFYDNISAKFMLDIKKPE